MRIIILSFTCLVLSVSLFISGSETLGEFSPPQANNSYVDMPWLGW